jgi:phosphoribosylamine--glycine ligase
MGVFLKQKAMNILLLGSGGRESAISWKLTQSPLCKKLFIAPGNAGTAAYGENVALSPADFEAIKSFCLEQNIHILLPGGEDTLVAGIYDFFKSDEATKHIIVAGPSKAGAQLEGSKAFAKEFMQRHNIPTAAYREFSESNFEEGVQYLKDQSLPIVLKADGLAAGKGVVIAQTVDEAIEAFTMMIKEAQFGEASKKVVIEQFLKGIELSVFVLTDGTNYVRLPEAKDYKRIGEGDTGPNTGGMGAVSPVPFADPAFMQKIVSKVIEPTVDGLKQENIVYQGFIFFGLINVEGEPYVIEYNCRMGDPETEVVMPRLENDLMELILKMNEEKLNEIAVTHDARSACTVMLVSEGYPGSYAKGKIMQGLDDAGGSFLFHAGTAQMGKEVITNGGRVLAITSYGENIKEALEQSYRKAETVDYEGKYFRKDIGYEFI